VRSGDLRPADLPPLGLARVLGFSLGAGSPSVCAGSAFDDDRASSKEIALAVDNRATVGSSQNDCPDGGWNTAAIEERESESPEMTAVIENNHEDRERTVVIDR
jgi:hypothetical protein